MRDYNKSLLLNKINFKIKVLPIFLLSKKKKKNNGYTIFKEMKNFCGSQFISDL